jgi:hypothetical protein
MDFLAISLMAMWIWILISNFTSRIPGWLIHLTVIPAIAYVSIHTPAETRNILAVAGSVMLLQVVVGKDLPTPKSSVKTRRRSSIPPPP